MIKAFKKLLSRLLGKAFSRKKNIKLGLYGPPNGGKTTLANRVCKDWLGEEMGAVSKRYDFKFGFKFQYRNLDTFIHPQYVGREDSPSHY